MGEVGLWVRLERGRGGVDRQGGRRRIRGPMLGLLGFCLGVRWVWGNGFGGSRRCIGS
jgi:hypothetical protein